MQRLLLSLLLLTLFSILCTAQEYAVIANKKMPRLTLEQIRAVYLKKLQRLDNTAMVPVNLSANDPLRKRFEEHVLRMSFQRLQSYWSRQHYLGRRPPVSMKSQESALSFVKSVEGAIAYVHAAIADDDVHILYRWSD